MNFASYELTTAPAVEPLSVDDDIKPHLALVGISTHDTMLASMAKTARTWLERQLNRGFIDQTWKLRLDDWPRDRVIILDRLPVQSVSSVEYLDTDHALQTLATTEYVVDQTSEPARVIAAPEKIWPGLSSKPNAVIVTFSVGYGPAASDVPDSLRSAMLEIVAHQFRHRGDEIGFPWEDLPLVKDVLCNFWSGNLA